MFDTENVDISELVGKVLDFVEVTEGGYEVVFYASGYKERYLMYHEQDCCEDVVVKDVVGNLENLVGVPLLRAEKTTNEGEQEYGTFTWTFYKFATIKGWVDLSWYGESNGYYTEGVDFIKLNLDSKSRLCKDFAIQCVKCRRYLKEQNVYRVTEVRRDFRCGRGCDTKITVVDCE